MEGSVGLSTNEFQILCYNEFFSSSYLKSKQPTPCGNRKTLKEVPADTLREKTRRERPHDVDSDGVAEVAVAVHETWQNLHGLH